MREKKKERTLSLIYLLERQPVRETKRASICWFYSTVVHDGWGWVEAIAKLWGCNPGLPHREQGLKRLRYQLLLLRTAGKESDLGTGPSHSNTERERLTQCLQHEVKSYPKICL